MVVQPEDLGTIEVKPGVFLRDVVRRDPVTDKPLIEDASDIPTGYALVNGKRAVYILVTKRANACTLDVVNNVRANLPKMQAVLPDDIKVSFEFDQSPYVTNSMKGVAFEGLLAAGLVGLMVLLFLRDWRSVIVVVLNIPLALVAALVALWLSGQTINLMTLGGLALAVGILVDEATVAVENIHVQMGQHRLRRAGGVARDHRDGGAAAAGDAVHPGGVHPVVPDAGGGPGAVRAAVAGGRVRDDRQLRPVQHVRPGPVGLAAEGPPRRAHGRPGFASREFGRAVEPVATARWVVLSRSTCRRRGRRRCSSRAGSSGPRSSRRWTPGSSSSG